MNFQFDVEGIQFLQQTQIFNNYIFAICHQYRKLFVHNDL